MRDIILWVFVYMLLVPSVLVANESEQPNGKITLEAGWTVSDGSSPIQIATLFPLALEEDSFFHPFVVVARIATPKDETGGIGAGVNMGYGQSGPHFRFAIGMMYLLHQSERLDNIWQLYLRSEFRMEYWSLALVHWSTGKTITGLRGRNLGETGVVAGYEFIH